MRFTPNILVRVLKKRRYLIGLKTNLGCRGPNLAATSQGEKEGEGGHKRQQWRLGNVRLERSGRWIEKHKGRRDRK